MFHLRHTDATDKPALYADLRQQLDALIGDETDGLANLANTAALLFELLPDLNWAGFYLLRADELVLGPFQGRVACVRIALSRGVCGASATRRETVVAPDVHAFPGHIACDAASRSEVVVPLLRDDALLGVLDLDSPLAGRFDSDDARGLEALVALLVRRSDWSRLATGSDPSRTDSPNCGVT